MNILRTILRAGICLFIALIGVFPSAVIFFGYSDYRENSDRVFLVAVPTLAIASLLFIAFPVIWEWLTKRMVGDLIFLTALALLGAASLVLPLAISRIYYLGMIAFALVLLGLMLPALPAIERMRSKYSIRHYVTAFILSLTFAYGAVGFFSGAIKNIPSLVLFTILLMLVNSIFGLYIVRRAARSHLLDGGFLNNPLNIFLALLLPAFLFLIIYVCVHFPAMFVIGYFQIPFAWTGFFLCSAFLGGVWGMPVLEQIEKRGWYGRLSSTKFFTLIKENLPGVYAGGMFFLINLVLARAFNHPSFTINSIIFEADTALWMSVLGYPEGFILHRAVHPLVLITLRPLVQLVGMFVADKWYLAPILTVAAASGICVFMAWLFVMRATQMKTYSFLFAILLGSTSAHLLFGSLIETYVFSAAALIFFWLLVQVDEKRFSVLIPAGLLVFGITITNLAQNVIGLFFKKLPFQRLVYFGMIVFSLGIALTALVGVLYPHNQTLFFVPADITYESRFARPVYEDTAGHALRKIGIVSRTIFLYSTVAPTPLQQPRPSDPGAFSEIMTYDNLARIKAWYDGIAYIPLGLWVLILAAAIAFFLKDLRSIHMPLLLGLLGSLAFNFILHMNYGTELFLYSLNWTHLLVFFVALSLSSLASRRWFEILLAIFIVTLMINDLYFLSTVMRGLSPYFAAS